MFVLGVDPGLTRCGYGVLERSGLADAPFRAVVAGVVETPPSDPVDRRLGTLAVEIDQLLDEVAPSVVVVERVFFQTNVRTAISVAQASGVILAAAARRGLEVSQYTPNEVKQAVVGHGGATKAQVQEMVSRLCGLAEVPRPPDVADALALAACYLTSERLHRAMKRALA
jgi:crossover junction endodeoxyribonuclease RuvC